MPWTTKSSVLARKSKNARRVARCVFRKRPSWPAASGGSRTKRISHLLPRLAALHPDIVFVIAGSGPERDRIEALASELGVDTRLRLLGTILDRSSFYDALDAFILPSLYEGLPMAILEAMSSGVPVLSSRLEGISAAIAEENEGLLAQPGDVADFSRQLSRLKESPELGLRLAQAARTKASTRFSASVTARRIESIYREELGIANVNAPDMNAR